MIPKQSLYFALGGFVIFFMFIMWTYSDYQNQATALRTLVNKKPAIDPTKLVNHTQLVNDTPIEKHTTHALKYILIWTTPHRDPLMYLEEGQRVFLRKKCRVINCYVTTNKTLMALTDFDVLLINSPEIHANPKPILPPARSPHQIYIFSTVESAGYYPLCTNRYDNYFNLTWTYKLNSDIFYGYMIIRNKEGEIIGPKEIMHWEKIEDMAPIDDKIKEKLKTKSKAAAWIVSNCNAPSGRDMFVKQIQRELNVYGMTVDIYGDCGTLKCPRNMMPTCLETVERDYYFYMSFENSFADDYVTEKVLHGLNHYTVPVVYGTANYTRFMPDGIYLNAKELGVKELAKQMVDIINDKDRYHNFFKWHNYYSYHEVEETPETDFHCKMCEKVNSKEMTEGVHVYEHLRDWWNTQPTRPGGCPRIPIP